MSNVIENIERLKEIGREIRAKIIALGGTSSGAFEDFAADLDTIPKGGGDGTAVGYNGVTITYNETIITY